LALFARFFGFSESGVANGCQILLNAQPVRRTNPFKTLKPQPGAPLDLKQIKQIIELMKRSELTEFAVEEEGFKLKIRRGLNGLPVVSTSGGSTGPFQLATSDQQKAPAAISQQAPERTAAESGASKDEAGIVYVKSPMVGTFYRAASPESKPFADSGTKVAENTVVCIIEAMKIMNEIQAEMKGTVVEVLVENGQPVEYGQRLFKIKQG
jgi:acetyl-CoA carboxylase biotin carboxyl carrier protein